MTIAQVYFQQRSHNTSSFKNFLHRKFLKMWKIKTFKYCNARLFHFGILGIDDNCIVQMKAVTQPMK